MTQIYIALDLELTGLDPVRDEIIEIGAVAFDRRRELGRFQALVKPSIPLPLQTERLTGIRRQDLARAQPFSVVKDKLAEFIGANPIVGQSSPRDVEAMARQGLVLKNPTYDTFDLASILLPDLPSYTLAAIAERLGVTVGGVHRALADAIISKDVFLALLDKAAALDARTLAEIVQLTSVTDWPLKAVFRELEREASRRQTGTSLAAVLAARGDVDLTNVDFLTRGGDRDTPLEVVEDAALPETDETAALLEPDGLAARAVPGYEYRPEQVSMLGAVTDALANGEHLIVEAGTGTGKSLAYLLPSAEFAKRTGRHVVVSTNTLTLQEQIVKKDVPIVEQMIAERSKQEGTDPSLKTAVVKGRTNYLCLRRWSDFRRAAIGLTLEEVKVLCRILVWLPGTQTGDRVELNLSQGEQGVWSRISAQMDDCLVGTCTFQRRGTCFLYRARRAAESAHLVVVNHSLLLSDLASSNRILPEYQHLIVDEAHHLEDEATRQFGFTVGRRDVLRHLDALTEQRARERAIGLVSDISATLRGSAVPQGIQAGVAKLLTEIADRVEGCRPLVELVFSALHAFVRASGEDGDNRRRLTPALRATPAWKSVAEQWDELHRALYGLGDSLGRLQAMLAPLSQAKIESLDNVMLEVNAQIRNNGTLRANLQTVIGSLDEDLVTWTESTQAGDVLLLAAPLEIGRLLQEGLFAEKQSVVLTSATLAAAGLFDYVRGRLGLSDAKELQLGSPFDYAGRSLILVPSDPRFPEPNQPGYDSAIANTIIATAVASGGRMMALFTSNAALRRARGLIKQPLERQGILVLGQNVDGPRNQLLNTLRANPRTVLLGTSSFWEGVDIPGDALSVLVIARLPFGVPSDPVYAARSETFNDGFSQFAVPQAILKFRQGFGRLIRSKSDRGIVLILDSRIRTKNYGLAFRRSLPATVQLAPSTEIPKRVADFLTGVPGAAR